MDRVEENAVKHAKDVTNGWIDPPTEGRCRDALENAYIAGHAAAMEWRPIAEAPKDGTEVAGTNGRVWWKMRYASVADYRWAWVSLEGEMDEEYSIVNPTHYREIGPLPGEA